MSKRRHVKTGTHKRVGRVTDKGALHIASRSCGYVLSLYLMLLTMIYPFLCTKGYVLVSARKWGFFRGISWYFKAGELYLPGLIPVMLALLVWRLLAFFTSKQEPGMTVRTWPLSFLKNLTATDIAVIAYLAAVLLSFAASQYKDEALWGYETWYMGLMTQLALVAICLISSRFFMTEDLSIFVTAALGAAQAVFLVAVLQRLGFDPFGLYEGLEKRRWLYFLSTIGQTTWYSAYLAVFMPLPVWLYFNGGFKGKRNMAILSCMVVTGMTLVSQNSDSAFLAFSGMLLVLFFMSFEDNGRMLKFLEVVLIFLLSFRAMGIFQVIFKERVVMPDRLSVFFSQGWGSLIITAAAAATYIYIRKKVDLRDTDQGRFEISSHKRIRTGVLVAVAAAGVLVILYIAMNTAGLLPDSIKSSNNYLLFDYNWGHYRGAIWGDTVRSWLMCLKDEPLKALFGTGPDAFYHLIEDYYSENVRAVASGATGGHADAILTNAHNEFLTAFVNTGIPGGIAYMAVFITAFVRALKHRYTGAGFAALSIASYVLHDMFCYQEYVAAPYIFAIMGIGERLLKGGTDA